MDAREQHRDRQELVALREEILFADELFKKARARNDNKMALHYAKQVREYRRRSNAICERLWPATAPYSSEKVSA